ncbi:Imm50 family immunity protein [Cohnella sp. GCM10027633]|uniref:Imm50 family immunity protein n=1 Tax=unclassified Cohnella TaxID=2636738 RepID=UPI00363F669C
MWADALDEHQQIFLKSLFNTVPQLLSVSILEIKIEYGDSVSIRFDLPEYADKPPQKWTNQGYNTVQIQLDFSGVYICDIQLSRNSNSDKHLNNIEIIKNEEEKMINIILDGSFKGKIKADYGFIQSIQGYINETK